MISNFSPICAAAITKESVDVNRMALPSTILRGYHFRKTSDGNSFEINSPTINIGIISILEGSLKIDQTSRFTPTITKKMGMKKPYPMESSFSTISSFGDNNDTSTPAKKAPKIFSAPTDSDKPTNIKMSAKQLVYQFVHYRLLSFLGMECFEASCDKVNDNTSAE